MSVDPAIHYEHSLWLVPAEPLLDRLRETIARLAATYDAVIFEPHVTLFSGQSSDDATRHMARSVAAMAGAPVMLTPLALETTDHYTKTLFVQFERSDVAQRLYEGAKRLAIRPSDYAFNPHLSLIYKIMPEAQKREIAGSLDLLAQPYAFDRLRAIETEIPLTSGELVSRWRVICDYPLG